MGIIIKKTCSCAPDKYTIGYYKALLGDGNFDVKEKKEGIYYTTEISYKSDAKTNLEAANRFVMEFTKGNVIGLKYNKIYTNMQFYRKI